MNSRRLMPNTAFCYEWVSPTCCAAGRRQSRCGDLSEVQPAKAADRSFGWPELL
jgi:hypothetical protein